MYMKEGFKVTMNARYYLSVAQSLYQFTLTFPKPPVQEGGSDCTDGEKAATAQLEPGSKKDD